MTIDWSFLATFVGIGLGAWLVIAVLGALVVGKSIRMADERELRRNDESPAPLLRGPGSASSEDG